MDLSTTKKELLKLILEIENKEFIQKIMEYVKKESADFWDELTDREKEIILHGIQELDQNQKIEFEELLKKIT